MAGVGLAPRRSMAAEDIRNLQPWTLQQRPALGGRLDLDLLLGLVLDPVLVESQRREAIERARHGPPVEDQIRFLNQVVGLLRREDLVVMTPAETDTPVIGLLRNEWRRRHVTVLAHPSDPEKVISVGVPFGGGEPIVCEEPRAADARAIAKYPREDVYE